MNVQEEKLINYFKSTYLPHDEFRLISHMFNIIGDSIQNIFYKHYFDSLSHKFQTTDADKVWYVYTVNAYYDIAIHQWCMIFASHSEPTHYSKLLNYPNIKTKLESIISIVNLCQQDLRKYITNKIDVNVYKNFHKKTKDYRDKYLTHREHHSSVIKENDLTYPELNICEETLIPIYLLLIKLANRYPNEPNQLYYCKLNYYNLSSIDQTKKLMKDNFLPLSFLIK